MMNTVKPSRGVAVSWFALALLLVCAGNVHADWSGGLEGGTVLDSDGDNATRLRLKLTNETRPLSHYIYADWIRSGRDNSYEAGYKPRYWFGEALYVFGEASTRQDKPRSIERELFGLTGVGISLLNNQSQILYAELGAGYRTTEFENGLEEDDTTGIARAAFQQILADLVSLELEANTNVSEEFTRSVTEAGISVRIPGGAVKYSVRSQRSKIGDADTQSSSESFVSFNYGF